MHFRSVYCSARNCSSVSNYSVHGSCSCSLPWSSYVLMFPVVKLRRFNLRRWSMSGLCRNLLLCLFYPSYRRWWLWFRGFCPPMECFQSQKSSIRTMRLPLDALPVLGVLRHIPARIVAIAILQACLRHVSGLVSIVMRRDPFVS